MADEVAHDPVVNPSIHYLGVEGATTLQDHDACVAQNARIMAERSDIYGDQGAYNFQMCNSHGIRFEGRGWGRDSAANGIGDYNGVNYNVGSRAMCVLVGTDDEITDVCEAGIRAFANEAVAEHGMQWPLRGHSEFVATSCPGDHLRVVVADVNNHHDKPAPAPTPPLEAPDMYVISDPKNPADKYLCGVEGKRHIKTTGEYNFVIGPKPFGGGATNVPHVDQAWFDSLPLVG